MSEEEALAFEAHPHHKDFLRLRAWDEAAKKRDGEILTDEIKAMAWQHVQMNEAEHP